MNAPTADLIDIHGKGTVDLPVVEPIVGGGIASGCEGVLVGMIDPIVTAMVVKVSLFDVPPHGGAMVDGVGSPCKVTE